MILTTLNRVKNNQIFIIFIAISLVTVLGLNIFFTYKNWQTSKNKINREKNLTFLTLDNLSLSEKKNYYNSDQYKQKLYKEEGLKQIGEYVIETELNEVFLPINNVDFTPETENNKSSNYQKWWNCFINSTSNTNLEKSKLTQISFCK